MLILSGVDVNGVGPICEAAFLGRSGRIDDVGDVVAVLVRAAVDGEGADNDQSGLFKIREVRDFPLFCLEEEFGEVGEGKEAVGALPIAIDRPTSPPPTFLSEGTAEGRRKEGSSFFPLLLFFSLFSSPIS